MRWREAGGKILIVVVLGLLIAVYRPIFIVFLFEILDILKNRVRQMTDFFPLDLVFVFGITASYFFSPLLGVLIFFLSILNRMAALRLEKRHITKAARHFLLFFLVIFFRDINFFMAALLMLVLNYAMKYALTMFDSRSMEKSPFHITNFMLTTLLFYVISLVHEYVPLLI